MANYNNHFELTLDTLAPTGSIERPAEFMKENANLKITIGDATYMYVWRDAKAYGEKADMPATPEVPVIEEGTVKKNTNFSTPCKEYYHLVLEDNVGNQSEVYNTELITFDNVPPQVVEPMYLEDTDSGSKLFTNDPTVNFKYYVTDNLSGVVSGRIAPVDGSMASEVTAGTLKTDSEGDYFSGTITLVRTDGMKYVNFYATDAAGNESLTTEDPVGIYLDTQLDAPILTIHKNDSEGTNITDKYVNYGASAGEIVASISTLDDVVQYRFWKENETEPADWTTFTPTGRIPGTDHGVYLDIPTQVSSADGQKNFYIRVKDRAGNIHPVEGKAAVTACIKLDRTNPVIATTPLAADAVWISNVEGHKTTNIHIKVSDSGDTASGVKNWVLKCNGSQIDSGTAAVDKDVAITSATVGMIEGSNLFTLEAEDVAGNSIATAEGSEAVVKLDTTAPTASIEKADAAGSLNTWYKDKFPIGAVTADTDGSGVATIYAWTSMTSGDESCPSTATGVAYSAAKQTIAATDITWALEQSADNYMHIKVVDAVGNVAYAHAKFGYDDVAPVITSFAFEKDYYNATAAKVIMTYTDATSQPVEMKVTGAGIVEQDTEWKPIVGFKEVTLTTPDGMKAAALIIRDNAGNESTVATCETELDRSKPVATIVLKNPGTSAAKDSPSNIRRVDAWVSFTDDTLLAGGMQYKVYGAGIGKAATDVEWKNYTITSEGPVDHMVSEETALPGASEGGTDGERELTVIFKDAAGNISDPANASFYLDTTEPEPEAGTPDYNRISKVHVLRQGVADKKCDEINFILTPHCKMNAFKVCAYKDQTAAAGGSHADAYIPEVGHTDSEGTHKSINMHGENMGASETAVNCKIVGIDYEAALNGGTQYAGTDHKFDGAHIIVVYVQDNAGNWSKAATFSA